MLTLLLAAALAQSPDAPSGLEGFDLSALLQGAGAMPEPAVTPNTRYVRENVVLQRWPDGAETAATLDAGDRVEIVTTQGALTRVRSGTDFGWLAPAALSETPVDLAVDAP